MINNSVDAVLIQLLSAVCVRRDIIYSDSKLSQEPFDHILGTLGRHTLTRAIKIDGLVTERYRLREHWTEQFTGVPWEVDHVFPLHQWKSPLLDAATVGNWKLDQAGLDNIRQFFLKHYVTAKIPVSLHRILNRSTMPSGWKYDGPASLWARYKSEEVRLLMKRDLRIPQQPDSDFVLER